MEIKALTGCQECRKVFTGAYLLCPYCKGQSVVSIVASEIFNLFPLHNFDRSEEF